jgi:hypothetical protein
MKKLLFIIALTATATLAQTPEQIIAQAVAEGIRQHQATETYWNSRGYYLDGYGNYRRETPRNTREIRQRHYDNDEILRAFGY